MQYLNIPSNVAKIYTGGAYKTPKHIQLLEKCLLEMYFQKYRKLIVSMPPRHGKSEYIAKYYPAWMLFVKPRTNIIYITYEAELSRMFSWKAREVYSFLRNDLVINRQDYWNNVFGGSYTAVGVGGGITGRGADLIIVDDPIKNVEQANSKLYREKLWEWFSSTVYTRLEPNGSIVIVATRWHYDDLIGRLRKDGEWRELVLKAIADDNDVLGRKKGESLWRERFDENELNNIKKQIGSYWFSCLYQQMPIHKDYAIFNENWWRWYETIDTSSGVIVQSWDTATKTKEVNDYSVCTTWLIKDTNYYLLDLFRDKLVYPDLEKAVLNLATKWRPRIIIIEDSSSGSVLIQNLKFKTRLPIKGITATTDKVLRASLITPLIEAGNVYLKKDLRGVDDLIKECNEFPLGGHDDIVDSITMALSINYRSSSNNVLKKLARVS